MTSQSHLVTLGFSGLEAAAYCALLEEGPSTAYRVAQKLGKPVANLYQGMASLVRRGAVEVDEDGPRTFRAVDPEALLTRIDRDFQSRRAAASAELSQLRREDADERIYQIPEYGQAMEHARRLIGTAREILVFDMFPDVLAVLAPALGEASARGVLTAGHVYADGPAIPGLTVRSALPRELLTRWPGQQLSVITDGARSLTALLDMERKAVVRAFATDSAYVACLQHSGLCAEIRLTALLRGEADDLAPISLLAAYPEGLRRLVGPKVTLEAS
jgi:sugar-specific transcriptional regulator TrmB